MFEQKIFGRHLPRLKQNKKKEEDMDAYGYERKIFGIRIRMGIRILLFGVLGWLLISLFLGVVVPFFLNRIMGF